MSAKGDQSGHDAIDNGCGQDVDILRSGAQPPQWQQQVKLLKEMMALDQPNPIVQRVKLIMAAGLMVVHAHW